jgi:glycosyltransferase involved in cell wall biosynthesis
MKPLVSVVTPCFNAADTLPRAVASVRRQTTARWEMVIADDGSTDGRTLEVARALVDDRVRLVELSRNRGPGVARNAAIHAARADIIMPLDADDELMPGALHAIVAAFNEDPSADFVYGPYIRVSLDGTEREIHAHPTPDPGIIPWHVLSPYRRRFWERAGGYDERPSYSTGAEDWIMWLRGLDRGGRGKAIPVLLMRYYRRAGSLSSEVHPIRVWAMLESFQELRSLLGLERAQAALGWTVRHAGLYWRRRRRPWRALGFICAALGRHPQIRSVWRTLLRCLAESLLPPLWSRYPALPDGEQR